MKKALTEPEKKGTISCLASAVPGDRGRQAFPQEGAVGKQPEVSTEPT